MPTTFAGRPPLVLLLALALAPGCRPGGGPPEEAPSSVAPSHSQDAVDPAAGPGVQASDLAPVLRAPAPAGTMPGSLVIELARQVVEASRVGEPAGPGTVLSLLPPVEGELRFTGRSSLAFTPRDAFAPGTRYEARLLSVETKDGTVAAPVDGGWSLVFETPAFAFTRLAVQGLDPAAGQARLSLLFTGPVEPQEVEHRARWTLVELGEEAAGEESAGGREAKRPRAVPALVRASERDPRELTVDLQLVEKPATEPEEPRASGRGAPAKPLRMPVAGRIELVLEEGLRLRGAVGPGLPRLSTSVELPRRPVLEVREAYRAEGANGFFVEVVCSDGAVAEKRWYWDQETHRSHELSRRCQLLEQDAAEGIRFEPEVAFTVSPSSGGFRILGSFERGSYAMTIDAGVRTVDGAVLPASFETSFAVPARSPRVSFLARGRYLPRSAFTSLPVSHLNVHEIELSVRQVPPENLVFWMSAEGGERADERTSNVVAKQTLPVSGRPDVVTTSYLPVGSVVPAETQGLVQLTIAAGGSTDVARLLVTDLQLVAKRSGAGAARPGGGEILAWAFEAESMRPAGGVAIELLRRSGQVLDSCTSDLDGSCRLEAPEDPLDPSPGFALVARRGKDLTYLKFDELEAEVQESLVAGEPYDGGPAYRALVYTERGVYRPGETVHLAALVRDAEALAPPAGLPVFLEVSDPRGQVLRRQGLPTNEAGMLELPIPLADFATTGRYHVRATVAEVEVGATSFLCEEFVPERLDLEVQALGEHLRGEPVPVELTARYLFGGVPAGHRVELTCTLEPADFQPRAAGDTELGVWRPEDRPVRSVELAKVEGVLDAEGRAELICPGGAEVGGFEGPARLVARAAVLEAGSGRTSSAEASAPVHPERFYLGLSTSAKKAKAGEALHVSGVVVDWSGAAVQEPSSVLVRLLRLETDYGSLYDEATGRWQWRRYSRPVVEQEMTAPVEGGQFSASLLPEREASAYIVQASAGRARTELRVEGSGEWYGWDPAGRDSGRTPRPDRPTWLAIEVPESARVGHPVHVSVRVPHAGRLLWTAETDEVLAMEWREVKPGLVEWSFTPKLFEPNVYVTALLLKPPLAEAAAGLLPGRSFGVASVRLEPEGHRLDLRLEVPDEVRSRSELRVAVDLGPVEGKAFVTIAAVDEGVLSLTRFADPDPFAVIFRRRALGVDTFETLGWSLLLPRADPSATTGGDESPALGRIQVVRPVALWSGLLEVPPDGRLEHVFRLPAHRGRLRVMVVGADARRMGHASMSVVVKDPLVLQATLPRFLVLGDEMNVPVFVSNASGSRREAMVALTSEALPLPGLGGRASPEPPVVVLARGPQRLVLEDGESATALFHVTVTGEVGAARLTAVAEAGDLLSIEELEVPVVPAGPRERRIVRVELEQGTTELGSHLEGWAPLTERTTIWVTANRHADAFGRVKELLSYPYGCLEQTASTLRPLLFAGELLRQVEPELVAQGNIEDMVSSGLERMLSMQMPDGAFTYWPGGTRPVYWGTAYATHLLWDARARRFPVSADRLERALAWMEDRISNELERGPAREQQQDRWDGEAAEPYMHYVLALAGRPRKARIERLLLQLEEAPGGPSTAARREQAFMLRAALHLAGDLRHDSKLKQLELSSIGEDRDNDWSFRSDLRTRAFMLSTFVDLFGRQEAGERLADLIAEELRRPGDGGFTTQELAWAATALGKMLEPGAASFETPRLFAEGGEGVEDVEIEPAPPIAGRSAQDRSFHVARASERRGLRLELPSKGEGHAWAILSSEGVREGAVPRLGGEGLRVTRAFKDAAGESLDLRSGSVKLGDLVHVVLTLENTTGGRVPNVALVDRIPAGFEIENPRLGRGTRPPWLEKTTLWEADHIDVRDDRLEVFGALEAGVSVSVVHAVRAVTAGSFTMPPVEAEAMYDPRVWARAGGGRVEIAGPWAPAAQ